MRIKHTKKIYQAASRKISNDTAILCACFVLLPYGLGSLYFRDPNWSEEDRISPRFNWVYYVQDLYSFYVNREYEVDE